MKMVWKRRAVIGGVVVLVCAAVIVNGKYAEKVESGKVLGQSKLVSGSEKVEEAENETEKGNTEKEGSDYFASARLSRQQSRDSAIALLQEQSSKDGDTSAAMASIETIADYTVSEAKIENMITAKGYADCVVFLSDDSASVVVAAKEDGLQVEDVAKITDIVKQETGLSASGIKILEVN